MPATASGSRALYVALRNKIWWSEWSSLADESEAGKDPTPTVRLKWKIGDAVQPAVLIGLGAGGPGRFHAGQARHFGADLLACVRTPGCAPPNYMRTAAPAKPIPYLLSAEHLLFH